MQKLLLFLALISGSLRALADGTIIFQNDPFNGPFYTNGTSGPGKVGIAPGFMMYGLFYSDASLVSGIGATIFHVPGDANHIGGIPDETIFAVPEPSALALIALGVVTSPLYRRRKY